MKQDRSGVPTRLVLVGALILVITCVTFTSLLLVRARMSRQVLDELSADLHHSVETFQNLQLQQRTTLQRENALLARLPSLKALMTTNDDRTIADGAVDFWHVSGSDLFALASRDDRVVVAYTQGPPATDGLRPRLAAAIGQVGKYYLLDDDGRLFEYSVRPLYFGSDSTGTLLGYVISGYAIDGAFVQRLSRSSSGEIAFMQGDKVVTSTLAREVWNPLEALHPSFTLASRDPHQISLQGKRYLAFSEDLSAGAQGRLQLVVMKPLDSAEAAQREINRVLLAIGLFAVLLGTMLMLILSSAVTGPLELLAESVRAFGIGDSRHALPQSGTLEVKELSAAFSAMREEIQQTNRALLESERLATIGRMASSVSHDLRHYLAAVYANAEFLASSELSERDRAELLMEIRAAVHGTTELIDSLLIFSRTGKVASRSEELIFSLTERAIALVRTHPDAANAEFEAICHDPKETRAIVDTRQVERAIYNLLLNACQSMRGSMSPQRVAVAVSFTADLITVTISDAGPGVPEKIRDILFEPFVSEGKQNGSGLGLTLSQCIAKEHGGEVRLVRNTPGETIFSLSVSRRLAASETVNEQKRAAVKQ